MHTRFDIPNLSDGASGCPLTGIVRIVQDDRRVPTFARKSRPDPGLIQVIQGRNSPWITGARVVTGLIQVIQVIQVKFKKSDISS